MFRKVFLPMLVLIAVVAAPAAYTEDCCAESNLAQPTKGYVPLFNGKDLSGWKVMGTNGWSVQDGVLAASGPNYGWLRTAKQYKDFIIELEYKLTTKDGNSGVFLRATTEGDPAFSGMEIQVRDDYGQPAEKHITGSVYDAIAPSSNPAKPLGQWNKLKISLIGTKLAIWENGKRIVNSDLADPVINAGLAEDRKLTKRAKFGYIGLQYHGTPAEFRNMKIKVVGA
jgi:hypothetical protein